MLRCSFCKRSQDVVRKLIASHSLLRRSYICDQCVAACNRILADDAAGRSSHRFLTVVARAARILTPDS
jgi:ATP-dependent protease Clp ATPase subunit